MKLIVTCQICGKLLATAEKDAFTDDDLSMYAQSSSCDTAQGTTTDGDGNTVTIYDSQSSIQVTKTQG